MKNFAYILYDSYSISKNFKSTQNIENPILILHCLSYLHVRCWIPSAKTWRDSIRIESRIDPREKLISRRNNSFARRLRSGFLVETLSDAGAREGVERSLIIGAGFRNRWSRWRGQGHALVRQDPERTWYLGAALPRRCGLLEKSAALAVVLRGRLFASVTGLLVREERREDVVADRRRREEAARVEWRGLTSQTRRRVSRLQEQLRGRRWGRVEEFRTGCGRAALRQTVVRRVPRSHGIHPGVELTPCLHYLLIVRCKF